MEYKIVTQSLYFDNLDLQQILKSSSFVTSFLAGTLTMYFWTKSRKSTFFFNIGAIFLLQAAQYSDVMMA
jgi:hypothetical protein